jgi:glycosyltransferase involved in cell wall biosynthesis
LADRALSLVHVFPSFSFGGQQRRLASLIEEFGRDWSHRIYALDGDISGAALIGKCDNVAIVPLPLEKSGLVSLANVQKLRRVLADAPVNLLCTYNFGSIEAVIANALGRRLPHVHHEDGFGPDEAGGRQKTKRVLARRILLSLAQVCVPSTGLEAMARRVWRLAPSRIHRIPVGIDLQRFSSARRGAGAPVVVGSLGALRAEKNFARLIRCFDAAREGRDAELTIVGDGPERNRLEATAAASPSYGRIALPGATAHPEQAFAGFDIFALSSDTEQTPTSLMEAMASGLPALATDVGDIRMMLGEENGGFVVAPGDDDAFIVRLRALIDDAALRRRLGDANRARAQSFDQSAMISAFRTLYLETAGAG